MKTETYDVQNTLYVLLTRCYLNVENPSPKLKKQYQKAIVTLSNARHEFDLLNDMKEELERPTR